MILFWPLEGIVTNAHLMRNDQKMERRVKTKYCTSHWIWLLQRRYNNNVKCVLAENTLWFPFNLHAYAFACFLHDSSCGDFAFLWPWIPFKSEYVDLKLKYQLLPTPLPLYITLMTVVVRLWYYSVLFCIATRKLLCNSSAEREHSR